MTDHNKIIMHREKVRVKDKELLEAILNLSETCCVALHDEPYPYIVPMNFGYEWNDKLIFYFHMAKDGHRIELIKKNPFVSVNVSCFLERVGKQRFRNESHDYRSVTAYGFAEIIDPLNNEEEYLHGFSILCLHTGRPPIKKVTSVMLERLYVLKITADIVTGKTQYPITMVEEIPMPENIDNSSKI